MILALSIYYQPFRAFLINDDGSIRGIYYSSSNKQEKNGFYQFPLDNLISTFLFNDIDLYKIENVAILGKPMLFFEKFLKDCMIPPGIKKGVKFGKGVSYYMKKIFRIKSDISRVLRHTPAYWFLSAMESCIRIPKLLNYNGDTFFWGINTEFAHSVLINSNKSNIRLFNSFLHREHKKYLTAKTVEEKQKILEQVIGAINLKNGLVVTNTVEGLMLSHRDGIKYWFDAPSFLLAGMCDLYFSYLDSNSEISSIFKTIFLNLIGSSMFDIEISTLHGIINISDKNSYNCI